MAEGRKGVAIVTGASGGLGAAVTRRLAARGYAIAMVDLRASWSTTALDTVGPDRAGLWAFGADLRFLHEAEATVLRTVEMLGPPSIVVNAPFPGRVSQAPLDWELLVQYRLRAPLLLNRAAERHLIESGRGRIVNLTRVAASKGARSSDLVVREALHTMTETLSRELQPHGVRVNTVVAEHTYPNRTFIDERLSEPDSGEAADESAAALVDFLISEAPDDITGRMFEARQPDSPPSSPGLS